MSLREFHTHAMHNLQFLLCAEKNLPTARCKLFTGPAESGWNLHRTRIRIFYAQHEEKRVNLI